MNVQKPNSEWDECAVGQLQSLSDDIRNRQRAHRTKRRLFIASSAAVILLGVGVWMAGPPGSESPPETAKLRCSEVIGYLAAYDSGELSLDLRKQIEAHLDHCPHCREQLEQVQSQRQSSRSSESPSTLARGVLEAWRTLTQT